MRAHEDNMQFSPVFPSTNGVTTVLPPPEGYVVNFDDPEIRYALETYCVAAVGCALMIFFLGQRLYTKIVLGKGLQIDDGTSSIQKLGTLNRAIINCFVTAFLITAFVRDIVLPYSSFPQISCTRGHVTNWLHPDVLLSHAGSGYLYVLSLSINQGDV